MLNKKFIKLLSITLTASSILATDVLAVSCGKKEPKASYKWADFKKDVQKETAMKIVQSTKPKGWEDTNANELSEGKFVFDDNVYTVTLDITRRKEVNSWTASFEIDYFNNKKYNVSDWSCEQQPVENPNSWDFFKVTASKVTAEELITEARNSGAISGLKWTYGTASQVTWIKNDKAEFDTFGAIDRTKDSYSGMKGKPVINEANHTITAIISKKDKNGAYDSDPIEATMTYKLNEAYDMTNWSFVKKEQLISEEKAESLFNAEKTLATRSANRVPFLLINWMTIKGYPQTNADAIAHIPNSNKNTQIQNALGTLGFTTAYGLDLVNAETKFKSSVTDRQITSKMKFTFRMSNNTDGILNLQFYFNYVNDKDNTDGLTNFNYTWMGTAKNSIY